MALCGLLLVWPWPVMLSPEDLTEALEGDGILLSLSTSEAHLFFFICFYIATTQLSLKTTDCMLFWGFFLSFITHNLKKILWSHNK